MVCHDATMKTVELNMADSKVAVHILVKHYWEKKGLNISAAACEICSVEEEGTVDDSIARKSYGKVTCTKDMGMA